MQTDSWRHPWFDGVIDRQPALFIVGSYRCGTTSLFNYFSRHPALRPCIIKEPGFFFSHRWQARPSFYPAGEEVAAYLSMFRGGSQAHINMEATSNYLHDPGCARRIAAAFPEARIVITLRDPVRRLASWYDFLRMQRWLPARVSVEDWLRAQIEDSRPVDQRPYPFQAVEHGRYSSYVGEYPEVFGRDRVRVVWHDDICSNPREVMRKLSAFVGVDPAIYDALELRVNNPAQRIRRPRLFAVYRRIHGIGFTLLRPFPWTWFRARNWFFGRLEPRLLPFFLGPAIRTRLPESWNRTLQEFYLGDCEALARLLGERPPWEAAWNGEQPK